jgi:hypothetical protein
MIHPPSARPAQNNTPTTRVWSQSKITSTAYGVSGTAAVSPRIPPTAYRNRCAETLQGSIRESASAVRPIDAPKAMLYGTIVAVELP